MKSVTRTLAVASRLKAIQRRSLIICHGPPQFHTTKSTNAKFCHVDLFRNANKTTSQSRQYHVSKVNNAQSVEAQSNSPSQVHIEASRIAIPVDGENQKFSAALLRDLCQCPSCVHESTNQKLYSVADIPSAIQARSVNQSQSTSNAVDITWSHDVPGFDSSHTTTLKLDLLQSICTTGVTPGPFQAPLSSPTSWEEEQPDKQPDFDYESYMQDDTTLYKVIQQLHTHGLVFLTEVPGIERSVSEIAERIGPVKATLYGHTWDVRTVPQAINAAYTSNDLGFHTDLLYFQNPPHIQFLHCIQSSSSGGASVFADAFQAAVELYETDREAFNVLATLPVNYQYKHPESNLYHATKPVFDMRPLRIGDVTYSTLSDFLDAWEQNRHMVKQSAGTEIPPLTVFDCLEKINWGPPFLAPFSLEQQSMEMARRPTAAHECLNQKMDEWHAAAKKFNTLLHRPSTLHERLMKPGECVLFNNTRVLHSRRAFNSDDVGKARWLRGTYVDKDPFFSKLRVLNQQFGNQ